MTDDILTRAATDPQLTAQAVRVLAALKPWLSADEYRPVKQIVLARQLGVAHSTIWEALRRLRDCGYVEPRYRRRGVTEEYRLALHVEHFD